MKRQTSQTPHQNTMNLVEWSMLIVLSILWGGSFFFNGVALQELPVFTVVFGRVCIAAIALQIFLKIRGISFPVAPKILGALLFMGFINNVVPFSLIVAGQTQIGSGLASVLNATTPLFTAVIAHLFTTEPSEKLTRRKIAGVLFGIIGVGVMIGPDISAIGFSGSDVLGQLAVLAAAASYGVALVFGRRFAKAGISPMIIATGQMTGATLLLAPLVFIVDNPIDIITSLSISTIAAIFALALFSTALAYILYFKILSSAGAMNASLVTLLVPVSAIILGILFLGEALAFKTLAGMGFVGVGLLVIDGRVLNLLKQKQPGKIPG
ncbi:MAG: DMT family transporter [Sneathiella sp.]|nr:DMT family transporter [Sneathiella sp.]